MSRTSAAKKMKKHPVDKTMPRSTRLNWGLESFASVNRNADTNDTTRRTLTTNRRRGMAHSRIRKERPGRGTGPSFIVA